MYYNSVYIDVVRILRYQLVSLSFQELRIIDMFRNLIALCRVFDVFLKETIFIASYSEHN